jgi:hypothetical protein
MWGTLLGSPFWVKLLKNHPEMGTRPGYVNSLLLKMAQSK